MSAPITEEVPDISRDACALFVSQLERYETNLGANGLAKRAAVVIRDLRSILTATQERAERAEQSLTASESLLREAVTNWPQFGEFATKVRAHLAKGETK